MFKQIYFTGKLRVALLLILLPAGIQLAFAQMPPNNVKDFERIPGIKPRNIIYVLSDDHRYDFMGISTGCMISKRTLTR